MRVRTSAFWFPSHSLRSLLAMGLLIGGAARGQADQELTLTLPPSDAAQARAAVRATTSVLPEKYRRPPVRSGASRGRFTSRGQSSSERIVGRLGQLLQPAPIYRGRSSATPRLTTAPAGTYLAIQDERDGWCGVLMADGSTGWVWKESMNLLDYQVVSNGWQAGMSDPAPWPSGSDPGDIYPRSERPYFTGDSQALLQEAYRYLGVRYVWGGNTHNGIDCSGFIKNIFGMLGYPLPRLGSDQMAYGLPVPFDQLQPGDRLYFGRRTERVGVKHTGLYIGNGYFIHASSGNHAVVISRLSEPLYSRIYVCARR